jgi:SAM-dependent methyltransferase
VSAYGPDLAHIHDVGWGDFARRATPGLLAMLRRGGIAEGLVVDLGCGSGIWARALVDEGFDVLGVDISAAMLEIARERVPEGTFVQASLFDVGLPPCAAITSIGECAGYAFDPSSGREALAALLTRAHAALAPGGMLIFDLAEPGREPPREHPRRDWHEGDGWTLCLEAWEDPEHGRLVRDISVFRRAGDFYRRSDERHEIVLHAREHVLGELEAAGFAAQALDGYGSGLHFEGALVGFAARKSG